VSGGRFVQVHPPGHDSSALDAVLGNLKTRRGATLLAVKCQSGHFLAGVYRAGGDHVYVANVPHAFGGIVEVLDESGSPTGEPPFTETLEGGAPPGLTAGQTWRTTPPPAQDIVGREQYVEFLGAMKTYLEDRFPDLPDTVPAACKCGHWELPRGWLRDCVESGATHVRYPDVP
jgi:hypothetical protein